MYPNLKFFLLNLVVLFMMHVHTNFFTAFFVLEKIPFYVLYFQHLLFVTNVIDNYYIHSIQECFSTFTTIESYKSFFQVGLISAEKLVNLVDLALYADTVNTVKNLRIIMETGVEPLALMSQLATVITDILAGSYDFMEDRHRRKFFQ